MLRTAWFKKHLIQIKQKAGERYTPKLNVDLPVSKIFDGISRTQKFYLKIRENYGSLLREFRYISPKHEKRILQNDYNKIKRDLDNVLNIIGKIKKYNKIDIPWNEIHKKTKSLDKTLWKFIDRLRNEKELLENTKTPIRKDNTWQRSPAEKFNSNIHYAYKVQEIIRYFRNLSLSNKAKLSNIPFLFLTGSAGTGKTHLLCDLAEHRINNNQPVFMVFGEYFSNKNDFWLQTISQLKIKRGIKTKKQLLKEMNEIGKKEKCRSLFIIDALNENLSNAPGFWKSNLHTIIEDIKNYPNIALIVSVRKGFEKEVTTDKQRKLFVHEEHYGFRFREWEAIIKFFNTFSLSPPEIPLLMPEFQNPLFLLLFCSAFSKKKRSLLKKNNKELKELRRKKFRFRGIEGATYIFEKFILNSTEVIANNFSISKDNYKSPAYRVWSEIIKKMASEMVIQNNERISERKLIEIIKKAYPNVDVRKFFQELESNMLIIKIPEYLNGKESGNFDVKFPFQKFSDHLIGRYIFKKYEEALENKNKNIVTAKKFFSKNRSIGKFLSKSCNRGIIEALSIQCPEQLKGTEFIEVVPYLLKDRYLSQITEESFIESLIWRSPKAFSKNKINTLKIINDRIIKAPLGHFQVLNALLSIAPVPNHPFNIRHLHKNLSKLSMPKRDSWWSTFLHYQCGKKESVDRFLEWALFGKYNENLNQESAFLSSITLSWFLTTPNRFIRDKATKGLVYLLQNKINLIPKLLDEFKNINDLYILERLFAVAYGCVLRNKKDKKNLGLLVEWIYKNIFKDNKPPVHILLRDYARNIVEVAIKRGLKIKKKNIAPPYKSIWPKSIPSIEKLEKKYHPKNYSKNNSREFFDIWSSVMHSYGTLGDFGNYVVSSHLRLWSGRNINNPEINKRVILKQFKKELSVKQKKLLEKATNPFFGMNLSKIHETISIKFVDYSNKKGINKKDEMEQREEAERKIQERNICKFKKTLTKSKKKFFNKELEPFLNDHGVINDPLDRFDIKLAHRWIFNRVIKLGYNPKLHGKFDNDINRHSNRSNHKVERIGKKYQWIAYHEFLALVSDHFEFNSDKWKNSSTKKEKYQGPWNPYVRDIDPSFILQNDSHIQDSLKFELWKLKKGHYDGWKSKKSDNNWIKDDIDLPNPKDVLKIIDDDNKEWLMLEGFIDWEEKTPPEYKKYDISIRQLWYMVKSYIVKKEHAKQFYKWSRKQNFHGHWMPESYNFYESFLGEYPKSKAFHDLRGNYNIWTKIKEKSKDVPSIPIVVTDDSYLNEFTLDCSYTGSVLIKLPSKWLVNKMRLNQEFFDGRFYDKNKNLITITTSIFKENSPSALLINKKVLIDFLEKNNYVIFWTLLGEKQLIGGKQLKNNTGRLDISGAYTTSNKNNIIGKMHCKINK
jgi:hypothetical protein